MTTDLTIKTFTSRHLILLGMGALCTGIIIGFKLGGGEKITLNEHPAAQPIIVAEPETNEVEND